MGRTGQRLFRYAGYYRKSIILALILLSIAVCAELVGPLIARQVIDNNITGIEKEWKVTTSRDHYAVLYNGQWYKRADHFATGELQGKTVRILQVAKAFYYIEDTVPDHGLRSVKNNQLTLTINGKQAIYPAQKISARELYAFYKPELGSMLRLAFFYFALLIVSAIFTYGQRYLLQVSANKIIRRIRNDVFRQIQRLPVRYFDNLPAGKVVSRITNDTEAIRELYVSVLANFFSGIIYITAIYGALILLDPKLALIASPLIPILVVWIIVYRKFASRYNHRIRTRLSDINGMINESIQGMPIIQAFRRQKSTMKEFEEINDDYFKYQNKLLSLNSLTSHNLLNVIRNLIFLVVIWFFAGDWLGTVVTIGVLFAFIDYMNRMFQPIVNIVNQLSNLETARVSAERVFELLDADGVDVASGDSVRYKGHVRFEDVSFAYIPEEDVLKHITFEANHGETVALVGHTGSGKSSILNLLFRFYDVERGRIIVAGQDILSIPKQQLRHHMGIVLQDPFLFTGTIASNVSLDDPTISRERVEQALRDVGAYEMFMSLPQGIDEPVIEKGSTLSGGQRQLISFARALAFDPVILILDEATASIDSETESIIQRALDVLKQGRTTFIIAHRLSTIRNADQILVMDHGRIMERGNHDQLMGAEGLYYQMHKLQST
ncbi:MAG: ABC transporter ATP-binding protein [Paenibacillaceae bacterium]